MTDTQVDATSAKSQEPLCREDPDECGAGAAKDIGDIRALRRSALRASVRVPGSQKLQMTD